MCMLPAHIKTYMWFTHGVVAPGCIEGAVCTGTGLNLESGLASTYNK